LTVPATTGSGRETRLLLLIIVVAVAVLLVLARFRFPGTDGVAVMPAQGPIERLAARATFEDLSLIVADVSARVQPSVVAVGLVRVPASPPRGPARAPARAPSQAPPAPPERYVTGLRIAADLALISLPAGFTVAAADGIALEATDDVRRLALVRVPETAEPIVGFTRPASSPGVPGYLVVAEGGRAGVAVRPVYLSRLDSVTDDRWTQPPMAIGGQPQMLDGALVFTLEGRLIGMAVADGLGLVLARASALESAVAALLMR
jgi:hypothetical protein